MRWHAPAGILLLFWPCAWGLILSHNTSWFWWTVFLSGSIVARTGGVIYNDIIDRYIDRQVSRTQSRPLACGELNTLQAIFLVFLSLAAGSAYLFLFSFPLQCLLSFLVVGIALYPFMKRWTSYPQIYLGFLFNMGLWVAASVQNVFIPWYYPEYWFFYGGGVAWTLWYDTLYAFQDLEDDKKHNVGSLAVKVADKATVFHGVMMGVILTFWWAGGQYLYLSSGYNWGLCILLMTWIVSLFFWPHSSDEQKYRNLFLFHAWFTGLWITSCLALYVLL